MPERALPTGTITFLFSDIEGSTRLVHELGTAAFTVLLERHNALVREAVANHGGTERGTQGDSFLVMFPEAPAAVAAAIDAQRAIEAADWPAGAVVRIRMGLHSGLGTRGGDDYVGIDVNRAARIASAARGGQILVSDATRALLQGHLPDGVTLTRLGEYRLRDLPEPDVLHQVLADGLPVGLARPNAPDASGPGNLPVRLTSFIGRAAELAELDDLLRTNRLLTLVGTGGTGKTSLAIELARRAAERYPDGAWFASLETVHEPELMPAVLAAAFELVGTGAAVDERLHTFLRDRTLLLVIDNFEHLLDAGPQLPELLRVAPGLTIVATSRAPLRVEGEQEFPVSPLPLPAPGEDPGASDALRLFAERASRVRPGYRLVEADVDPVSEICRRLDGLPLGIEIAASRMALLPARDIADRLGHRLELPGAAPRDAPERQRTLQATIGWSYDLLSGPERHLLDRLSVFAGSVSLAEAEQVCGPPHELGGEVLDGISTLAGHSLVQSAASAFGARFRLLTTIRMFAAERLEERGETAELRRRHAAAYLALAERIAPRLPGRGQKPLLDRLAEEHDNLRAAIDEATIGGDTDTALRLGAALWRYWQGRGHLDEGRATIRRVLAMPGADAPSPARLGALDAAGGLAWWQGDLEAADAHYAEQVALARRIGDRQALAFALSNLSHTRVVGGDPVESRAIRDEAIRLFELTGDLRGAARVGWIDANERMRADPSTSRQILEDLLRRYTELEDDYYVAMASGSLAWTLASLGAYEAAVDHGVRALDIAFDTGDIGSATIAVREMEALFFLLGHESVAATLDGTFEALCSRYAISTPAGFAVHADRLWPGPPAIRDRLGNEEFERLRAVGATMGLDEARALVDATVARVRRESKAPAEPPPA